MAKETARKGFRNCDCTPIIFSIEVPDSSLAHPEDGKPAILKAVAQEYLALFEPLLALTGKSLKQAADAKSITFQSCWRLLHVPKYDLGITTGREGLDALQLGALNAAAQRIARQVPAAFDALYRAPDCMNAAEAAGDVERALRLGFSDGLLQAINLQILINGERVLTEPLELGSLKKG